MHARDSFAIRTYTVDNKEPILLYREITIKYLLYRWLAVFSSISRPPFPCINKERTHARVEHAHKYIRLQVYSWYPAPARQYCVTMLDDGVLKRSYTPVWRPFLHTFSGEYGLSVDATARFTRLDHTVIHYWFRDVITVFYTRACDIIICDLFFA